MSTADVIIVGLGGMGSAAAAHLAARGQRVIGLEQFGPAHDRGSSHGETRMIRQSYFEDPSYVPLLLRAYELWEELNEERSDTFVETGGLMLGSQTSATVAGSLRSAREWDLPHELLDAAAVRARFPVFEPGPDVFGFYEDRAGFVRPEQTVQLHLDRAARAGADLHFHEPVTSWTADPSGEGVVVHTATDSYYAGSLVICAGAWAPTLLAELGLPLEVERQLLFWFAPTDGIERYRAPAQPVFIWEDAADGLQLYGFPADGPAADGVKVAFFRGGPRTDPDALDRELHGDEIAKVRDRLARCVPGLAGRYLRGTACMYTNTPDENFVIATHPHHRQVTVAAGFSGHGFKFVPVVGEILADLVTLGRTAHPIDLFDPQRF